MVNGLIPSPALVPGNAQYYRIFNHLDIISDYAYNKSNLRYEPLNPIDGMSVFVYSDYTPVNTPFTAALNAVFPEGTVLSETDTVLQCIGIEYYIRSCADGYVPYSTGSKIVDDVF